MSVEGAMITYVISKVEAAVDDVHTSKVEKVISDVPAEKLPFCMVFDVNGDMTPADFRQQEEVTNISLAYVDQFDSTQDPVFLLLDVRQAIKRAIWDGNAIDTDAAGFLAYSTAYAMSKPEAESDRHVLVMEVVFETMDVEDSAFALTE